MIIKHWLFLTRPQANYVYSCLHEGLSVICYGIWKLPCCSRVQTVRECTVYTTHRASNFTFNILQKDYSDEDSDSESHPCSLVRAGRVKERVPLGNECCRCQRTGCVRTEWKANILGDSCFFARCMTRKDTKSSVLLGLESLIIKAWSISSQFFFWQSSKCSTT